MKTSAFRIEYGNNIVITTPIFENLYIAGGTVTISAPIHGDLIVAGGTIVINDTIFNDILIAGGKVLINGNVGNDLRCVGGEIHIMKNITGDVAIAGGKVFIENGAATGSLLITCGDVTVDGKVNGELKGTVGNLLLNGNIVRNIDCRGGKISVNGRIEGHSVLAAKEILIGNNAVFENDVRYWNGQGKLNLNRHINNGNAIFDPALQIQSGEWYYLGTTTFLLLLWYLGMVVLMLMLIQYLFSCTFKKAADTVYKKSLKSLGAGFLFIIGLPIAGIIAIASFIGMPIGFLLIIGWVLLILLSSIIVSVMAANWLNNRNNYRWNYWRMVFAAFGIFVLLKLLTSIPFIGWLLISLLTAISLGAILLNVKWRNYNNRIIAEDQK